MSIVPYLEGIYFSAYYLGLIEVFHCVQHNESYNTMDCVNKITHYFMGSSPGDVSENPVM